MCVSGDFPARDGAVVMSANGDWQERPAQLQAMVFCRLQQARPGDAEVSREAGKGDFR